MVVAGHLPVSWCSLFFGCKAGIHDILVVCFFGLDAFHSTTVPHNTHLHTTTHERCLVLPPHHHHLITLTVQSPAGGGRGAQMPDAPDGNPSSCPLARDVWASLGTCRQGRTSGRISARCWLSLQRARGWTSPPWRLSHQCVCVDTAPSRVCVFPLWSPVVRGTCSLSLPARVDLWRLVVSAVSCSFWRLICGLSWAGRGRGLSVCRGAWMGGEVSCHGGWAAAGGDMSTVVVDCLVGFPWYTAVEGGWGRWAVLPLENRSMGRFPCMWAEYLSLRLDLVRITSG